MCMDGFLCLLMSLGAFGKGECINCEIAAMGNERIGENAMVAKTVIAPQFEQIKKFPRVCGRVGAFADVFGGCDVGIGAVR